MTTVEDSPAGSGTTTPAPGGAHNPLKPRSWEVTDGDTKAPARAMLRAVGMGDDDWVKPQIGVEQRTADRHALENGFEKRDGRRCRRRVTVHRLQGVLLVSGRRVYRPGAGRAQARGWALKYALRTCSGETCV